MTWSVNITDLDLPGIDIEHHELAAIGASLSRLDCKTEDDVITSCQDADALLVQWAPISRRVIERLPNLKAISRYGIGYDMVDVAAASERGIPVSNVPHYCTEEVATHAFTLLLTSARRIIPLDASVRSGSWNAVAVARPITRLRGQILGLVGGGRIGRQLATMAIAAGLRVQIYDPYAGGSQTEGINFVDWPTLLATSDFISIHCPLSDETVRLFGADAFAQMKPSAVLINTSRGGIVDTSALYAALSSGEIGGAAVDVLEVEPPPVGSIPSDVPNLIITPHAAWYSEEALIDLQRLAAHAIVEMYETGTASTAINVVTAPVQQSSDT